MNTHTPLTAEELALHLKEIELLKHGFDALRDHVVVTDRDAHILYMNKAAEQTTGYSFAGFERRSAEDYRKRLLSK